MKEENCLACGLSTRLDSQRPVKLYIASFAIFGINIRYKPAVFCYFCYLGFRITYQNWEEVNRSLYMKLALIRNTHDDLRSEIFKLKENKQVVEPSGLWGPEPVQKVYTLDEDNEVKLKAAINEILAMAAKADIVIPVAMIEKFKELVK